MLNEKAKFRTAHVKAYNVEEIVIDSTTHIMDNVYLKDVDHFCYHMTTTEADPPKPDF